MRAVLTGDVVGSTRLDKELRKKLFEGLQAYLHQFDWKYLFNKKEQSIFFRGDSFQIGLAEPEKALEVGLMSRMLAKAITNNQADVRFSIGIGKTDILTNQVNDSDGPVFWYSGRSLDKMKRERMRVTSDNTEWDKAMNTTLLFADQVITGWSKEMAEVSFNALSGKTQIESAEEIGVSQSAVNQRLRNAKFNLVKQLLQYYKEAITWI